MKKTVESIDLAKFIASIFVFATHCKFLSDYKNLQVIPSLASRWTVPFFFVCSAYFLFSKSKDGNIEKDRLYGYIKRIGALYAVWFVYNIPSMYFRNFWQNDLSAISTWLVFLKKTVLASSFKASWYLASSIFSTWFVYILSKKFHTKTVMGLTFVLYLFCVFSSAYQGLAPASVSKILDFLCFPRNIFYGCFFFAIGKYVSENLEGIIRVFDKKRSFIGFAAAYLLLFAELILAKRFHYYGGTDAAFSTVLMPVPLFLFCLQTEVKIKNSGLLRKLSTIIYCAQGNVLLVNDYCKGVLRIPSIPSFLISSVVTAIVCVIVLYIQKNKKWSWTQYLT